MRNIVSPPAEGRVFPSAKAEDQCDDETGNRDANAETCEDEIGILSPPRGVPTLEVELEEPCNVNSECRKGKVIVASPVEGAR